MHCRYNIKTFLAFAFLVCYGCKQKNKLNQPIAIPTTLSFRGNLITKITPNEDYNYWEYITVIGERRGTENVFNKYRIISRGNKKWGEAYLNEIAKDGFVENYQKSLGYSYIAYIDHGKIRYITEEKKLKPFIGLVDNLQEALLIAQLHGFKPIFKLDLVSSYRFIDHKFELYQMKKRGFRSKHTFYKIVVDRLGNCTSTEMQKIDKFRVKNISPAQ